MNLQRLLTALVPVLLIAGIIGMVVFTIGQSSGRISGDELRLNLWHSAVGIVSDHPVLGIGPGLFGRGARQYRDPAFVDDRLGTAHSILLNTAAEEGVLGVTVLAILAGLTFRAWWRLWRGASPERRLRLEAAFAALVGISLQSLFDTFTTTPLLALIALLAAYCTVEPGSALDKRRGSRPAAAFFLALVIGFGLFWVQSDRAQSASNRSVRTGDIEAAREAASIDPALHLYPLQLAYLTGQQTPPNADPSAAIAAYQQALVLEPTWDTGWLNLAALLERSGDVGGALTSLQRAEAIHLSNAAAYNRVRLSETYTTASDDEIVGMYVEIMPRYGLPLSGWWMLTDIRRSAVMQYYETLAEHPDQQYRVAAAHFPERLSQLLAADPQTAAEWWVIGMYALEFENDPYTAFDAFSRTIRLDPAVGDTYVLRARAGLTLSSDVKRDLNMARLLSTQYESVNALLAESAFGVERERLLATAVAPRIISQNFEGVLFGGRTASFELLPEMRYPGPGSAYMQPWYDLAALYEADGRVEQARSVYLAILDYAPGEQLARERLANLDGN
jgi:tetratricopeptide (TPR) repeat protein